MATRTFTFREFPRKLVRQLWSFAGAGTLMAFVVWSDATGPRWLAPGILVACLAIPLLFVRQVKRQGFDPLERLVATDRGLEAHERGGACRFMAWEAIERLVEVEGFRHRSWAIVAGPDTLRWFGELDDPDGLAALVAERTGLSWQKNGTPPAASA